MPRADELTKEELRQRYRQLGPEGELVGEGKNAKYVKECVELHLGHKGIDRLWGFERLTNLESLYLNDNDLMEVTGLDDNFRIRHLSLQNNALVTLNGSILKMHFLQTLDLSNNNLRNLTKLLSLLSRFNFLHSLELKGNPCCEEPDYRLCVIGAVPSLHVLDLHMVTDEERTAAAVLLGKGGAGVRKALAFGQRAPPVPRQVRPVDKTLKILLSRTHNELAGEGEPGTAAAKHAGNKKKAAAAAATNDLFRASPFSANAQSGTCWKPIGAI
mmetsp:Transcript_20704/g.67050  ORF Transcript_20704/g.67050 Transcript_20704/m.67050 type:complete len:272 (-) Transcript_20704:2571-3386(-)